jgi:phosphoribosylamine-glycine ligase
VVTVPGAQDHKRALDGDRGLNTGGMGAYAPAPTLTPELREKILEIMQRTVKGVADEGVLYGGFMISKDGPIVLDYNVRFGDPETQVLMPLLDSDVYDVFMACAQGRLAAVPVRWKAGAASTVVMATRGYPDTYPKGTPITGLMDAKALAPLMTVCHAGTKVDGEGRVVANGGRVLAVTGLGRNIRESLQRAYQGVQTVRFDPAHYRTDIGHRALKHPVLVLGAGGREHATALKLAESRRVSHVYVARATAARPPRTRRPPTWPPAPRTSPASPSSPRRRRWRSWWWGPRRRSWSAPRTPSRPPASPPSARAQRPPSWRRPRLLQGLMARHNIPTARYRNFTSYEEAVAHVQSIDYPVVLKADGSSPVQQAMSGRRTRRDGIRSRPVADPVCCSSAFQGVFFLIPASSNRSCDILHPFCLTLAPLRLLSLGGTARLSGHLGADRGHRPHRVPEATRGRCVVFLSENRRAQGRAERAGLAGERGDALRAAPAGDAPLWCGREWGASWVCDLGGRGGEGFTDTDCRLVTIGSWSRGRRARHVAACSAARSTCRASNRGCSSTPCWIWCSRTS